MITTCILFFVWTKQKAYFNFEFEGMFLKSLNCANGRYSMFVPSAPIVLDFFSYLRLFASKKASEKLNRIKFSHNSYYVP